MAKVPFYVNAISNFMFMLMGYVYVNVPISVWCNSKRVAPQVERFRFESCSRHC